MKEKMKTVLLKWFFSYLLILGIPIILSIGIYTYSLKTTINQSNKMNDVLMSSVKSEIDNHINEIDKMLNRVALDADVQYATIIKNCFTSKDQIRLYHLVDTLQNLNMTDEFIEDIFIYFNNTGTVSSIKGNMSGELYYHLYYENSEYDFVKFEELMKQDYFKEIVLIHKLNGETILLFTMKTLITVSGQDSGMIVIAVNQRNLQKIVENMKWDESLRIFVMNGSNEVINTDQYKELADDLDYKNLQDDDHFYKDIMGERYVVSVEGSDMIDWKYVCMTPNDLIQKSAKSIHNFSLIGLFICILVGAYFSYFLAKSNYNPLKGIVEIFRGQASRSVNQEKNEYQ